MLLPLLRHVVSLNKGRCARGALRHTFDIGVFNIIGIDTNIEGFALRLMCASQVVDETTMTEI